jgi:hypothetical protein
MELGGQLPFHLLYPPGKSPWYPMDWSSTVGHGGKDEKEENELLTIQPADSQFID